jgi:hypothetical protein
MRFVLAAVVLALALPGAAAAACWNTLLQDYFHDGRIDGAYTRSCYRDAIRKLPVEQRDYTDVYDVLSRALARLATKPPPGQQDPLVQPPAATTATVAAGPSSPPTPPEGPLAAPAPTGSGGGVPTPLIVLGGLGLLFAAGGLAGTIVRRRRSG